MAFLTEADVLAHCLRHGLPLPKGIAPPALSPMPSHLSLPTVSTIPCSMPALSSRCRSQTESRYAMVLEQALAAQEILAWWYEPVTLNLARRTTYRPDFVVLLPDNGLPLCVEVKGAWIRDRALDKLKIAARMYARLYRFQIQQWKDGAWYMREVPA